MKIQQRLLFSFLGCGLVPLLLLATINYLTGRHAAEQVSDSAVSAVRQSASDQLQSIVAIKKQQVEDYFGFIRDQILTFSEDQMVVDSMRNFSDEFGSYLGETEWAEDEFDSKKERLQAYYERSFQEEFLAQNDGADPRVGDKFNQLSDETLALQCAYIGDNAQPLGNKHQLDAADNDTTYDHYHEKVHPIIRDYLDKFGYYDIFLVDDETGHIVYSVFKELDFGTSLKDGPYSGTNFGRCFQQAAKSNNPNDVFFVDFEQYWPSYQAPASFIACPVFDEGERIGVAMFQMPVDRINDLMALRAGLGERGETMLVGPEMLPRSDSFLAPDQFSIVPAFRNPADGRIDTTAVTQALEGESNVAESTDYLGEQVLAASAPVDVLGVTWAVVASVPTEQAFAATEVIFEKTAAANSSIVFWAVVLTIVSGAGVAAFAFVSVRGLMKPIHATIATLRDIAEGEGT